MIKNKIIYGNANFNNYMETFIREKNPDALLEINRNQAMKLLESNGFELVDIYEDLNLTQDQQQSSKLFTKRRMESSNSQNFLFAKKGKIKVIVKSLTKRNYYSYEIYNETNTSSLQESDFSELDHNIVYINQ